MASRAWIKIHCDRWFDGTIRQEAPVTRAIWVDRLARAGSGRGHDRARRVGSGGAADAMLATRGKLAKLDVNEIEATSATQPRRECTTRSTWLL